MSLFDAFFPAAFADAAPHRPLDPGGHTSLNRWVLDRPEALTVFQELGLDACCGGGRTLAEACRVHGLDTSEVLERLEAVAAGS